MRIGRMCEVCKQSEEDWVHNNAHTIYELLIGHSSSRTHLTLSRKERTFYTIKERWRKTHSVHNAHQSPLFVQYLVKKEPTAQRTSELRHKCSYSSKLTSSQAHGELPYLMNRVPDLQGMGKIGLRPGGVTAVA